MLKDEFAQAFSAAAYPGPLTGRYELLECLGAGEGRETLLARELCSGSLCVVKCYTGQRIAAGRNEAALLQGLCCPAIPRYLGFLETASMFCVVREYVPGITLDALYRKAPPSEKQVLEIGLLLCGILTCLHSQTPPVIHRDIKPQNLIMREGGGLALVEFAISRSYHTGRETDTVVMGTRHFAAPEQYGFSQTDGRADIFSLGMVLCFLLTGGTDPGAAALPEGALKQAILRCTQFAPQDRFQSAGEVKAFLSAKPQKSPRRRASRVLAAAAALLALAAAIPLGAWLSGRSGGFREPLIEQAALVSLGLPPGGRLTAEDCRRVTSLYLLGTECCADADAFYGGFYRWGMSGSIKSDVRDLRDLERFPNLMNLGIYGAHISDLTPLAALPKLSRIALGENDISDCTPLAGMRSLRYVHLFHNPLLDASALARLPNLFSLELGLCDGYDPAFLSEIHALDCLGVGNLTDSYRQLAGMRVRELWLSYSGISDLADISQVQGLEYLVLSSTPLSSLQGIEAHTQLKTLELCGTAVSDLTPLLSLPALEQVTISESMRACAEAIAPQARFEIVIL